MVNQYYYPRWTASVYGGLPLAIKPAMPEGLLEIEVPPGNHEVLLSIPATPAERVGCWISAVTALLGMVLAGRKRN